MFIQYIAYHADDLTHRKRGEDRSDSKPFDMTEETESQSRGHGEAGHVEGDLDSGVWNLQNIGHFSRKEVCRDDRKSAAVGEGDSEADDEIAHDKIAVLYTSNILLKAKPTTKLKRYVGTNFFRKIMRAATRIP